MILVPMTWVIVGLGNPGEEYESTRHNAGRMAVMHFGKLNGVDEWKGDPEKNGAGKKALAHVAKVGNSICVLPDTFMNKSGSAVLKYVKSAKAAEKMIVAYDDLDLPLGTVALKSD